MLALLIAGATCAQGLRIQDASAAEVGRQLEKVVGAPVEVQGGAGRRFTLALAPGAGERVLDRLAVDVRGKWRRVLHVRPGRPPSPEAPAPLLDETVAVGVQDVPASRAFGLLARRLKAELRLQGTLDRRVAVLVVNVPASTVLDQVAEQAGATWSLSYLVEIPDALPVKPAEKEIVVEGRAPPAPAPPVPAPAPLPTARPVAPQPPSGQALRTGLWDLLNYVVRVGPDQRAGAVGDFLQYGREVFTLLRRLPAEERQQRIREAAPVLDRWRRLYNGLPPSVARELAPVTEFLERNLR